MMEDMIERLETVAPDLVARINSLPDHQQERIARFAAQEAVKRTGLNELIVSGALAVNGSGEPGAPATRSAVEEAANRLDELPWDIQDLADDAQAYSTDYLAAFRRARAAWSVYFALEEDPALAALEATYEAQAALSIDDLREMLEPLLSGQ